MAEEAIIKIVSKSENLHPYRTFGNGRGYDQARNIIEKR